MTVKETLSFSARCQGVVTRYEILAELSRREKAANIKPDPDIDVFMKATALEGQETNIVTDYILKILGLEACAETMVGDEMIPGISGGQKKRVTTGNESYGTIDKLQPFILLSSGLHNAGEMLVGPARALFMDEISTGLDSSTTFQIVNSLRQSIHILNETAVISLLQPAPETYELFDDIILLSEGQIVYEGPRENVLGFFEHMGFKCPERKGVADFLQEVTSRKDQEQYWACTDEPYNYVSVEEFAEAFRSFHIGQKLRDELAIAFDKSKSHPAALTTKKYGLSKGELLKACVSREILLMKRNSFAYIFNMFKLILMAFFGMTIFLRTEMHRNTVTDGGTYFGALYYAVVAIMFNGLSELAMTVMKLPVFYKERDLLFYPSWAYALPTWILKIPINLVEVSIWVILTYYVIGFDPNFERFFKQCLMLLITQQMASSLFRLIAALGRNMIVANTIATLSLLATLVLGGFILSRAFEKPQAILSEEAFAEQNANNTREFTEIGSASNRNSSSRMPSVRVRNFSDANQDTKQGMVLPFQPLSITFDEIRYAVHMPQEMKALGITADRLELLKGISGAFRPGVLTALMGSSGAGKTTLMDVLAGRKTGGYIEGNMTISGYPKRQETFARISDTLFIEEVMELVELTSLREAIVGLPGVNGLSIEQRKRMTIAVELVANPSIIFMDEPTSGLDARAAAIVMRIGGQEIYVGPVGRHAYHLIRYFEEIEGVPRIKDGYNPATWMLEVSTAAQEAALGVNFTDIYKNSELYRRNKALIKELSKPPPASKDLYFPTQYSKSFFTQCMACLWKQHWSYWRNPPYSAVRLLSTTLTALMIGTIFWNLGSKRSKQQDILNAMGSIYAAVFFLGFMNASSVQPVVAIERTVFYRERAAAMYSALPYAFGQVVIELPYILFQTIIYVAIVYAMIGFEWTVSKFFWHILFMYFSFLYFTLYGMMTVAATPNQNIASRVSTVFYLIWNITSGFIIPRKRIPVWWRWCYWTCPVSWTFYGLVASQYGDVKEALDTGKTVEHFLRSYFGFRHDFIGVVAMVHVGIAMLFGFVFAFSIKSFNFQKR
ncbi:hypothetical protein GH714_030450 [Hevea brasiliensis]|uniref:ABC transporter domain-containing protein n=1 Tax=Hevea brasiliensis TaxID=3981 RepID=A0A6A6N3N8_HEVBR|nr:hypothetical protein GH714_030450 [Hevea brasiliensis]